MYRPIPKRGAVRDPSPLEFRKNHPAKKTDGTSPFSTFQLELNVAVENGR